MNPEIERLRELGRLIRVAYAEVGTLQVKLIEAHARELNPAELGVQIANLGQQISAWKREQEALFRLIVLGEAVGSESPLYCSLILDRLNARQRRSLNARQTAQRPAVPTGSGDHADAVLCTS